MHHANLNYSLATSAAMRKAGKACADMAMRFRDAYPQGQCASPAEAFDLFSLGRVTDARLRVAFIDGYMKAIRIFG